MTLSLSLSLSLRDPVEIYQKQKQNNKEKKAHHFPLTPSISKPAQHLWLVHNSLLLSSGRQ